MSSGCRRVALDWRMSDFDRENVRRALELLGAEIGAGRSAARALLRALADDFRDLRTVELRGWVLARTEARLCASPISTEARCLPSGGSMKRIGPGRMRP